MATRPLIVSQIQKGSLGRCTSSSNHNNTDVQSLLSLDSDAQLYPNLARIRFCRLAQTSRLVVLECPITGTAKGLFWRH
jgi:hypothetical protein